MRSRGELSAPDEATGADPCSMVRQVWSRGPGGADATRRGLRRFACACARRVWHLLDEGGRGLVLLAEAFAEGRASDADRAQALRAASESLPSRQQGLAPWAGFAYRAAWSTLLEDPVEAACRASAEEVWAAAWFSQPSPGHSLTLDQKLVAARERHAQADALRGLFPPWVFSRGPAAGAAFSAN